MLKDDDYTSIKYLMKELDPDESVEFEQRMLEDEDLLLEVECMRRTLRRLEKLPLKQPPSEVTEYIVRKACSRNRSSSIRNWGITNGERSRTKYYAAAALMLIGMGIGLLSFQYADNNKKVINTTYTVNRAEIGRTSYLGQSTNSSAWLDRHPSLFRVQSLQQFHNENFWDTATDQVGKFVPPIHSPLFRQKAQSVHRTSQFKVGR